MSSLRLVLPCWSTLSLLHSLLVLPRVAAQAPFNPGFNETWNRNYFGFPALVNWIPVFKVGDTINASWSDDYVGDSRYINVWCGTSSIAIAQTFNSLEQNGNEMLSVINTWQDPCHLEFVVDAANGTNVGSFNSGAFNINNSTSRKAATPTTWAATGPSGSVETSSSEVTNNNNNNNNNGDASTPTTTAGANGAGAARMVDRDKGPSFGAGVGVGIAISVVIGALVVATFWLAQRARNGKGGRTYAYMDPPGPGYVREWPPSRPPMEMPGEGARVEMPAVRY